MWAGASPVPAQMWAGASPVPAQMWAGPAQSWRRCGRGEPGPGADVGMLASARRSGSCRARTARRGRCTRSRSSGATCIARRWRHCQCWRICTHAARRRPTSHTPSRLAACLLCPLTVCTLSCPQRSISYPSTVLVAGLVAQPIPYGHRPAIPRGESCVTVQAAERDRKRQEREERIKKSVRPSQAAGEGQSVRGRGGRGRRDRGPRGIEGEVRAKRGCAKRKGPHGRAARFFPCAGGRDAPVDIHVVREPAADRDSP
jgi:hypothetical protein